MQVKWGVLKTPALMGAGTEETLFSMYLTHRQLVPVSSSPCVGGRGNIYPLTHAKRQFTTEPNRYALVYGRKPEKTQENKAHLKGPRTGGDPLTFWLRGDSSDRCAAPNNMFTFEGALKQAEQASAYKSNPTFFNNLS